jgi:hypothetical protein
LVQQKKKVEGEPSVQDAMQVDGPLSSHQHIQELPLLVELFDAQTLAQRIQQLATAS